MLIAVIGGVHKSLGLTRGYWKSTESPIETSTVVSEASKDVASVTTQVTWNKDVVGKQPVPDEKDGVDDGLIRPWPARKRGQSRRGSSGHFYDNYPDFPSTTIQPKRGSNKNIYKLVKYVSLSFVTVQCFYLSKVFLILSIYICLSVRCYLHI